MSATVTLVYVTGNQGETEFEVHAAGCTHVYRLHPRADATLLAVNSVDEFVAAKVEEFDSNGQGWTAEDFKVFGCARRAEVGS